MKEKGERKVRVSEVRLMKAANVRRDAEEPQVWRPTGQARKVWNGGELEPFYRLATPQGEWQLAKRGSRLARVSTAATPWEVEDVGAFEGEPLLVEEPSEGTLRILRKHREALWATYTSSGEVRLQGEMPALPPLRLAVTGETTISEAFNDLQLSGLSSARTGSPLTAADTRVLTAEAVEAYGRLEARVARMGYFLQPVLARWRVEDAAGATLAVGPTALYGTSGGFQGCQELTMTSSDGLQTLSQGAIMARCYRLELTTGPILPTPWHRIGARAVVEVVPQLCPVNRQGLCTTASQLDVRSNVVTVRFFLPGTSQSMVENQWLQAPKLLEQLEGAESSFEEIFTAEYPYSRAQSCLVAMRRGRKTRATASRPANDATYSAALQSTGAVFLGNPRRGAFQGYNPACYATGYTSLGSGESWRGYTATQVAVGAGEQRGVATAGDNRACPALLSPLIVFPSARATSLTLSLQDAAGSIVRQTFALTPLEGCDLAYYLDTSMKPFSLPSATSYEVPQATLEARTQQGRVESYAASDLSRQLSALDVTPGREIVALVEAPRAQSSWDFARRKVLMFGGGGISVATADGSGKLLAAAPLDRREVVSAKAVVEASGRAAGGSVLAIAGGDLVEVTTRTATTLLRQCRARQLGWCARYGEIWLDDIEGGPLRRYTEQGEMVEMRMGGEWEDAEVRLHAWGTDLLLLNGGATYLAGDEVFETSRPPQILLRWRFRVSGRVQRLRVRAFAERAQLQAWLGGDSGTAEPDTLCALTLHGSLNAPLVLPLEAPRREYLETELAGAVSPDARIMGVEVE